jgi:branched-subunit amino acid transport protein AzlD
MNDSQVWLTVAVIALVTAGIRFLPFVVFSGGRRTPAVIERLGAVLPCAIMGMLVIYCLKDVHFTAPAGFLPQMISCAVVVLLHVWKRSTLLSIIGGTLCCMVLTQLVF